MKFSKVLCVCCLVMALLCSCALASEIGDVQTENPGTAPSGEIETENTGSVSPVRLRNNKAGEIAEKIAKKAELEGLEYELTGGVLDAEGNWLYAVGDIVSWNHLPEGSKVGLRFSIINRTEEKVELEVLEKVNDDMFDRGTVTVEAGSRYSLWRYYAVPGEIVRNVVYTVNGEDVTQGTIAFTLDGAPETVTIDLVTCEMDINGVWVRDFGDTAHRAQIDVGQNWGYVMHVHNNGAEEVTLRLYDSVNGSLYDWGDVTVAAGSGVSLPTRLRGTISGERTVYCVVNGEKIIEKTLNFVQD